jgi:hypothetical protein
MVALVGCGRYTRRGDKPNLSPSTLFAIRQMIIHSQFADANTPDTDLAARQRAFYASH